MSNVSLGWMSVDWKITHIANTAKDPQKVLKKIYINLSGFWWLTRNLIKCDSSFVFVLTRGELTKAVKYSFYCLLSFQWGENWQSSAVPLSHNWCKLCWLSIKLYHPCLFHLSSNETEGNNVKRSFPLNFSSPSCASRLPSGSCICLFLNTP